LYIGPTNHLSHYSISKEPFPKESVLIHEVFILVKKNLSSFQTILLLLCNRSPLSLKKAQEKTSSLAAPIQLSTNRRAFYSSPIDVSRKNFIFFIYNNYAKYII